jgi:hypothetical protein
VANRSANASIDIADFNRYGEYSVASNGTMNLPGDARRALGIEDGAKGEVLMFGRPGCVILTPVPLAADLLAFAVQSAAEAAGHGDGSSS